MKPSAEKSGTDKVHVDMTPMIDVVFQLLIFFMVALKIVDAEGDFRVRMPLHSRGSQPSDAPPPLHLYLQANADGDLQAIHWNQLQVGNFEQLRRRVAELVQGFNDDSVAAELEVEIETDPQLHYKHVVAAITAISGERSQSGNRVPYIQKINFAPPRQIR